MDILPFFHNLALRMGWYPSNIWVSAFKVRVCIRICISSFVVEVEVEVEESRTW